MEALTRFAGGDSVNDRLRVAEARVREQFPGLRGLNFLLQPGRGPGFAETFPADEAMNPNPGRHTIEIRRLDLPDDELSAVILGEALHLAPLENQQFRALKSDFMMSLKPSQLGVLKKMYDENRERAAVAEMPDKRSFREFIEQAGADAFIRDWFFQRIGTVPGGKPFVSGVGPVMGAFFPDQVRILEKMEHALGLTVPAR